MRSLTRIKILSVVFVLLLIAAYFSLQQKLTTNTIKSNDQSVAIEDTASIDKITIEKEGELRVLTKSSNSNWLVNNKYKVRTNVMNLLLLGLNQLEIKRPVSEEMKSKSSDLLKRSGTRVTVEYGDQKKTLLFASNENDINTSLLKTQNSSIPYIAYVPGVPGDINNIFKLTEQEWRSRELFSSRPGEIQSLKVSYPKASDNFEIYFQGGSLILKDVAPLDSNKLFEYLELFRYAPVASYLPNHDSVDAKFKASSYFATIDLVDINSSKSNSIQIYKNGGNGKDYLGKIGNSKESVLVNKEIFDRLLVNKAYFVKK